MPTERTDSISVGGVAMARKLFLVVAKTGKTHNFQTQMIPPSVVVAIQRRTYEKVVQAALGWEMEQVV